MLNISNQSEINLFILADFLLHPYRKPKRIRTAFAPLQLLELENAFEGNQYVVGSERKALAKTLNLTETQVIRREIIIDLIHENAMVRKRVD